MMFIVLIVWSLLILCGYAAGRHQSWVMGILSLMLAIAWTLGTLQPWNDHVAAPLTEEERLRLSDRQSMMFTLLGINCGVPLVAAAMGWGFRYLAKRTEDRESS
jgi:hypothetical protein